MNGTMSVVGKRLLIVTSALTLFGLASAAHAQAGVPPTDAAGETNLQAETHFLSFIGSFVGEDQTTSAAYYKAIGAVGTKENVTDWLVNAGFIANASQWHSFGPQKIACDLGTANGCDMPAHDSSGNLVYGDNIINTDSHAIVLNAADLGFVRNQFIRCKPNCSAPNPIIYTYLENYPVGLFALTSGFPNQSGYPTQAEANAAVRAAINRPAGTCPAAPANFAPGGGQCKPGASLQRIADVMFEWAPPYTNPTSSTRFGQQYAYFVDQAIGNTTTNTTETLRWPSDADALINHRPDFTVANPSFPAISTKTGAHITFAVGPNGDFFAPELDGRGFKQHPTVCLICHGGQPTKLTSTGLYPRGGNINGFRFLPLDIVNLNFSSENGPDQPATNGSLAYTDKAHQELQIREYNRLVLATVDKTPENDGTGSTRPPHLATVINGWYAPNFTAATQNSNFVPPGWAGFETLYTHTVGPSCRTCHFNREISLDFGTVANFNQESDILQLALIQECKYKMNELQKNATFMPLAHLTYERYWQTQNTDEPVDFGNLTLSHEPDRLADHFGLGSVNGYCATNP